MKASALFSVASAAALAASAGAVEYSVASCAELADVDDTVITSLVITASPFACDSYTRFRVRNTMLLSSTEAEVVFSNFALKVLGELTVDPDVVFKDVVEQVKNGGALYVADGASATFNGETVFQNNTIISKDLPDFEYKIKKGGAIHNKGTLVFEGPSTFALNEARTSDTTNVGRGGGISNTKSGSITFKSTLSMTGHEARGSFEGDGGAIYTRGTITVEGESSFVDNKSADGGAITIEPPGTVNLIGFATFSENLCKDARGGAVFNLGALNVLGGSLFDDNFASSAGDGGVGGAIYNSGDGILTFGGGDTTFSNNWAAAGGAIYNTDAASIVSLDDGQLVFTANDADTCADIFFASDADDDGTCGP